jgi:uncharacterized protein (UPF0261 family)
MASVVLIGSFDTKGVEYAFLRDRLVELSVDVVLVDIGVVGEPMVPPDIPAAQVSVSGGSTLGELRRGGDRGEALGVMARGATQQLLALHAAGRVDGAMALGGTGGTSVASEAFRALPLGIPKLIVSTAASGNTAPYVGVSDLILIPSVTDIAGLNPLLRAVIANSAAAMAGMVTRPPLPVTDVRRAIGASMFGVTTPCVTEARRLLDERGFETLVFHMTGVGGKTLEQLIRDGWLNGVLDVTTTELADELVGGVFSAGPDRLTGAASQGIPQVVSVGALDMVNFGPMETVPSQFLERRLHRHNASVTLMRTTPEECSELGRRLAERLSASTGPAAIFLPLGGVSMIATPDGPFYDPEADAALFEAIRTGIDGSRVELVELDTHINDPAFATAMVDRLLTFVD